jgi:altronate dehydratase
MPTAQLPPPGTGWKIESQTPGVANYGGTVTAGVTINFTTGRGHPGVVFVPSARYNVAAVQQMVTEQATVIDNVGALTG